MNLSPIAHKLAELLRDEGATDLMAGSEETKDEATRLYFAALSSRKRTDEMVEAISERLNGAELLAVVGDDAALGALIAGDLYLHAEEQLREPVAEALAALKDDTARSRHNDIEFDNQKEQAA